MNDTNNDDKTAAAVAAATSSDTTADVENQYTRNNAAGYRTKEEQYQISNSIGGQLTLGSLISCRTLDQPFLHIPQPQHMVD